MSVESFGMKASYSIRNYRPRDFTGYVRLLALAESLEPSGRCVSSEDVATSLKRPGYSPERGLFVAETGGELVAYLDTIPELGISRAIFNCWVAPDYRRQSLATNLIERAIRRARELGAIAVQMNVHDGSKSVRQLAVRLGFEFARRFLKLRLSLEGWPCQGDLGGVDICNLEKVGLEGLLGIQNRAFTGNWGYCPNTLEEIAYYLSEHRNSPEDIIMACEGTRIIGYCWTKPACGPGELLKAGQIFMLGVDPDFLGMGLGRKLMTAGLAHLKGKGLKAAWLEVDGENKAALSLYESMGFRKYGSSSWYEKVID